jgi:hypothetical protein
VLAVIGSATDEVVVGSPAEEPGTMSVVVGSVGAVVTEVGPASSAAAGEETGAPPAPSLQAASATRHTAATDLAADRDIDDIVAPGGPCRKAAGTWVTIVPVTPGPLGRC